MSRSGPPPRLNVCPTCGKGWRPWLRPRKGGRTYIAAGRWSYGRRTANTPTVRVYWPAPFGFLRHCPDPWHQDFYSDVLNPKQEHSRRTTPPRPPYERPGRAEVDRRQKARARRHREAQSKDRR